MALITIGELARRCGVTRRTAYSWVYNSTIPAVRVEDARGNVRWMVEESDVITVVLTRPRKVLENLLKTTNLDVRV